MEKIIPNPPGVVISTITFYPEISGTGQILTDLAVALAETGMKVKVFSAQPHYYEKHTKLPNRENYRGVEIHRIPSTKFDKNFRPGRILNWLSFTFFAFFYLLFEKSPYPFLLVSSPPVLPFVGWILKKMKKKEFVYLIHDLYPDIGVKLGFFRENGLTVKIWDFLNKKTYAAASKIVVLSEDMAKILIPRLKKEDRQKVEVIHNWANEEFIQPIPKEENLFLKKNLLPFKLLVQYSGNMGFNHDLEPLIEAAKHVNNVGFLFIGEGGKKEKLQAMATSWNLGNVYFFPFQPREELAHSLSASNLSVVTLEKGLEGMAVPSKFYSILASGRPVMAFLDKECEMAWILKKYDCGFVIPQKNVAAIIEKLELCLRDPLRLKQMGENARRCFMENFTREQAAQRYQTILLNMVPNAN